jgi:hypothetical protein
VVRDLAGVDNNIFYILIALEPFLCAILSRLENAFEEKKRIPATTIYKPQSSAANAKALRRFKLVFGRAPSFY